MKFYLTDTLIATWFVMIVLTVIAVIVRIKLKKFSDVPSGFQNVVEIVVDAMDKFTISTMGEQFRNFGSFFFGIFAFILFANYSSLLGFRPPTADLSATVPLAAMIFVVTQAVGIRYQRMGYLKSFIEPNVVFLPINIIGEISNLLSLCFRLFGNMLGSVIIIGLIYNLLPFALRFIIPIPLHAYFDVFAGALQAFIFTVLGMTFIRQKGAPNA